MTARFCRDNDSEERIASQQVDEALGYWQHYGYSEPERYGNTVVGMSGRPPERARDCATATQPQLS